MLANLLKSLTSKPQARYTYELCRQLCSPSNKEQQYADKSKREEDDALKIEANLFEQASIRYEPVTAEEVLRKNVKQKLLKTHQEQHPSPKFVQKAHKQFVKKSRQERESKSRLIDDKELGLEYLKLDLNDPRLGTLMISARSKKRRDKDGQIVIEGRRLILEALECGLKLNAIIFSQKEELVDIKEPLQKALQRNPQCKIYKVPHHDLKTWSTLTTPPGVMTLFQRPSLEYIVRKSSDNSDPLPLTVVCDNIREPNNLGSIIRTCAALPCFQIVVTKGCCDPWESKALRGGCGGHFRVPIRDDVSWENVPLMIPPEMAENSCVFIAENNKAKLRDNNVDAIDYSQVEKTGAHNVVVIGGESHGVSSEAYRFMSTVGDRGKCLNIPLAEGFDSLNVASALTLILYELRKNILQQDQPISSSTSAQA
ncbi:rRNA methyltransferase 3, mitochondrial-like [Musca domestica]|uniref:rRNA methyltransferase 3, mitochondrial-like n=1 Tax=Musca domestica TaxID=7370 RepID=A0ABM3UPB0_MUSDO|nr:rRNA methyltransferase 3, mitochondrial-like [Musca domestica]